MALTAKAAILQALIDGPSYGLEIISRVESKTAGLVRLGQGSAYPALRALEREGLLVSYEESPIADRGGRPRRYYELTADGIRKAREQQSAMSIFFASADLTEASS